MERTVAESRSPRAARGIAQASWALAALILAALAAGPVGAGQPPPVGPPPEALKAHPFYKKHVSAGGLPVLGSAKVADAALREAAYLVSQMLAGREDVRKALIAADVRIVVMHPTEKTTDVPEHSRLKPKEHWDRRARGLGGRVTSCGEENLLNYPNDPYRTENILVHEFAHCIHEQGLNRIDKGFDARLRKLYEKALAQGLWKGTYAAKNHKEYWAEGVQSYFDTNRQNDHDHNHVNTREELAKYDPALAGLIGEVLRNPKWRYRRPGERGSASRPTQPAKPAPKPEFVVKDMEGYAVHVNKQALDEHPEVMARTLDHLANQLYQARLAVPAATVEKLKLVPIWVEYDDKGCMAFHPRRQWLLEHGHHTPPEGLPSLVGLANARSFLAYSQTQPWMVLHELSHGYDYVTLGQRRQYGNEVNAAGYQRAMASRRYETILHHNGRRHKPYCAKNRMEFFAETTEAYFGTNDIYPFVRAELRQHDPETCRMLEALWGVDPNAEAREADALAAVLDRNAFVTPPGREGKPTAIARPAARTRFTPTERYGRHEVEGWHVLVHPAVAGDAKAAGQILRLLRYQLHLVKHRLPAAAVGKVRQVRVWVERDSRRVPFVTYHSSKPWLAARGANPDKAGDIEIGRAADYVRWAHLQPSVMIRQLACAYHHRVLDHDNAEIQAAYERAVRSCRYDSVLRFDGRCVRHPAMADARAFFAELSEALLATNDHYPFLRVELREHDAESYRALAGWWGLPKRRR